MYFTPLHSQPPFQFDPSASPWPVEVSVEIPSEIFEMPSSDKNDCPVFRHKIIFRFLSQIGGAHFI